MAKIARKDWRRGLHNGDEVCIDTGDNELPPTVTIQTIKYLPGDLVKIRTTEGEDLECLLKEIS